MVAGWPPHETADSFVGGGLCSWVEYQQAFLAYRPVSGTSRQCGGVVTGAGVGVTHYWVVDQQAGTGGGPLLGVLVGVGGWLVSRGVVVMCCLWCVVVVSVGCCLSTT